MVERTSPESASADPLVGLAERLDRLCLTSTEDGRRFVLATESARNIVEIVREWIRPSGHAKTAPDPARYWRDMYTDLLKRADAGEFSGHAQTPADSVQDTWFTDHRLPIMAVSGDVESERVLKLHFRNKVTDADRKRLIEVLNAGEVALSDTSTIRGGEK